MRIGIISEGHADRAVITNILIGLTGIDSSDIEPLRPIDKFDATDKAVNPKSFGGWTSVKEECETRTQIDDFLAIEGQEFIVVHMDSAEADQYGVVRPNKKDRNYCDILRNLIISQINSWLKMSSYSQILYAIAVEEIDAWVLTIYDPKDSVKSAKPKEKLGKILGKAKLKSTSDYKTYLSLSKDFSIRKKVTNGKFLQYNGSLKAFFEEISSKVTV